MQKKVRNYRTISLLQFQRRFGSEAACWRYLINRRWGKRMQYFECPRCGHQRAYPKEKLRLFRCAGCHWNISPLMGTLFEGTHVALRKWFWAIYLMSSSKKGVSALYLQRELELGTYRSAWRMAQKIRTVMKNRNESYRLRGSVEVDEIWLGAKRGGRKQFREKARTYSTMVPYLMQVQERQQRETGKILPKFIRLQALEVSAGEDIYPTIDRIIEKGSILKTDGSPIYRSSALRPYKVEAVNAVRNPIEAVRHLRWVNLITSNLKRYLLSTHHGVHAPYRKNYVAEFEYRFNRRFRPQEIFDRLWTLCITSSRCFVG